MPPRLIVVIQIGTLLLAGLTFASNTFKFEQNVIDRNWRNKETQFVSKANIQIESGLTSEDEYGQRTEISHSEKTPVPAKCGYQNCDIGKEGMLNVHLVPHTHDDVGWLRTVDQYYYGVNHAGVQYILDSAISQLNKDPVRRFIYVEIAFFARWWDEQHDSTRHIVKRLVNEGRLEFILGGWCMNDEAGTHYNAIIDQHTVGFRFLEQNFGECGRPKIAWQIDPFGHSREQASLFAQFGFDGLFFGRLDYQDKDKREKTKTMELMWKGSDDLGTQGDLFTGVNYNGYSSPPGFNFNVERENRIMDDRRLEDYNVDAKVKDFLKYVTEQAKHYSTNHIMLTMGDDFWYEAAHINYKNMDKLIQYVNNKQRKDSKVNVFYSTPSCYLYALNQANQSYTTKTDDFFPYAHRGHSFWTGYFTSRPALKGYVRQCNNFLQVCKQLDVLADLEAKHGSKQKLGIFKKAMGVAQHHDAVSGTEQQHVARDYAKRLAKGAAACQEVVNSAYGKLLPRQGVKSAAPTQYFCNLLNVSMCEFTETNKNFTVTVFNPIGRPVTWWVNIPVTQPAYSVLGPDAMTVEAQVVPLSPQTREIPAFNSSNATGELVFQVQLPPLGLKTFFVEATMKFTTWQEETSETEVTDGQGDITIKNKYLSLTVDGSTGLLKSVTNFETSVTASMNQTLLYYKAFKGNNSVGETQASGAYIFRSNGSDPVVIGNSVKVQVVKGSRVQEIRQIFSDWASQVIRLYSDERHAEFEWTVGPIPVKDGIGKEVISRFTTSLGTQSVFYTDSNGRQMLKRVRDYRPTWKLNQTEKVAGNYYPVNSRIFIRDEAKKVQLTVLTDRSQGGASIHDGEIELMVHRRLLVDDHLGVGEPLNETGITGKGLVVRGKHYLLLDTIERSAPLHRDLAERLFMAPSVTFSQLTMSPASYNQSYNTQWCGLKRALPANVHLLTLEEWEGPTYLLRLEHFYEKGDDATLSKPTTVSLKGLFNTFEVASVEELTLGANQLLKDAKRLHWNVQGQGKTGGAMSDSVTPVNADTLEVTLQPMQIRTFKVTTTQGHH